MTVLPATLRAPGQALARRGLANPVIRLAIGLLPIVVLLLLYELLAVSKDRVRVFPTLGAIWASLAEILSGKGELGNAYTQMLVTSGRLVAAFLAAAFFGTLIGIAAGRNKLVFAFVENLVWVFMAVPSVVWVFLFVVGLKLSPIVPIGALGVLLLPQFVVLIAEGSKSVPEDLVEMARSYRVTTLDRLTGLFLPFLVPYLIASARVGFATAVKVILIAEVIGQPNGIGFEVKYWYGKLFLGPVIAWGITMIVGGLLVDKLIFDRIEKRVSQWKTQADSGEVNIVKAVG